MTGFGKASVQLPDKKITAEIKSLNSKQFDMQTRIPSFFRELEQDLLKDFNFFVRIKMHSLEILGG